MLTRYDSETQSNPQTLSGQTPPQRHPELYFPLICGVGVAVMAGILSMVLSV